MTGMHTRTLQYIFRLMAMAILIAACARPVGAQQVVKKVDNGEDTNRFVCVLLAEGYTQAEQDRFDADADQICESLFSEPPFSAYQELINLYTVFTPSQQSGADHPSRGAYVDTAFDATYDTNGIARLLSVDESKAFSAAAAVPHFDMVFVMVNDDDYGGSGGSVIVFSTHASAGEIALHESGHVLGGLADEYETPYPGYPAGDSEPNVTFHTESGQIPWKEWITPGALLPTPENTLEVVGLFEGARYLSDGIYRPRHTCRMRQLNKPFCEICQQAMVLNLYSLVSPIDTTLPVERDIECADGESLVFAALPARDTSGHTYESMWLVDDEAVETTGDPYSLEVPPAALTEGSHTVTFWIADTSPLVRHDPQGLLSARYTWSITKPFCSGALVLEISDASTGAPVPGVQVSFGGTVIEKTAFADNGTYWFQDLACGAHAFVIEAAGYEPRELEVTVQDGATTQAAVGLQAMDGACYIAGTVTGDVAESITIELSGPQSVTVQTGSGGNFVAGPLEPGEYRLRPRAHYCRFVPPVRTTTLRHTVVSGMDFTAKRSWLFFTLSELINRTARQDN